MATKRKPRVGIALGGGAARGWAHIGILQWLKENGVSADIVCGTSIGALVGAAEASNQINKLQDWVLQMDWQDIVGYMDVTLNGGLLRGKKLFQFFESHFGDGAVKDLDKPFAAVATDLESGQEIWLTDCKVQSAIRASIAVPGVFTPERIDGRWLVDGGLVNPVPVSLCRALGADIVIGVDLNSDVLERRKISDTKSEDLAEEAIKFSGIKGRARKLIKDHVAGDSGQPSLFDVVARSIYIMQVRITRSRLAGDPPELLLMPRIADIGFLEFHRAEEAILEGRKCAEHAWPVLQTLLAKR